MHRRTTDAYGQLVDGRGVTVRMQQRTAGGVLALVLGAAVLAGCSGGPTAAGPPVVVPGAPGEPAQVRPAEQVPRSDPAPTAADLTYLRRMIPHHEQAVLMTDLAATRAADPRVVAVAERIGGTQRPEIAAMQQLADGWTVDAAHAGHGSGPDHAAMPGMAGADQLDRLRASTGPAFDALFLDLMTAHHRGALVMAGEVLGTDDVDPRVELLASDVIATQNAEIRIMEELRATP